MLFKSLMFQKQSHILPASMAFGLQTSDERYKLKTFVDECLLSGFSCLNLTFCAFTPQLQFYFLQHVVV